MEKDKPCEITKKNRCFFFLQLSQEKAKQNMHTHTHTLIRKATHTHTRPPASPVYVLTSPRHHSLYCVHPASRPNELSVYLTLAAGKRGGEVTNQSRTDRGKQRSGKGGEALCTHLPAIERLEQRAKKKKTTGCHIHSRGGGNGAFISASTVKNAFRSCAAPFHLR